MQEEDGSPSIDLCSMFDEELNAEFLAYDGCEVHHERDVLLFRYTFCDAVNMAPELRTDLSQYRKLVADWRELSNGGGAGSTAMSEQLRIIRARLQRLDRAARAIGMVYLAWFFMRFFCPRLIIRVGPRMGARELAFWREHVFLRSLGEFYLVNRLDFRDTSIELVWAGRDEEEELDAEKEQRRESGDEERDGVEEWWERRPRGVLVPLGAGKDSLLAFETLKRVGGFFFFFLGFEIRVFERATWQACRLHGSILRSAMASSNATGDCLPLCEPLF